MIDEMSYQSHKETCAVCDGISWYFYWKGVIMLNWLWFQVPYTGLRMRFSIWIVGCINWILYSSATEIYDAENLSIRHNKFNHILLTETTQKECTLLLLWHLPACTKFAFVKDKNGVLFPSLLLKRFRYMYKATLNF